MQSTVYAGAAKWTAAKNKDHQFGLFRLKAGSDDWENLTAGGLPDIAKFEPLLSTRGRRTSSISARRSAPTSARMGATAGNPCRSAATTR